MDPFTQQYLRTLLDPEAAQQRYKEMGDTLLDVPGRAVEGLGNFAPMYGDELTTLYTGIDPEGGRVGSVVPLARYEGGREGPPPSGSPEALFPDLMSDDRHYGWAFPRLGTLLDVEFPTSPGATLGAGYRPTMRLNRGLEGEGDLFGYTGTVAEHGAAPFYSGLRDFVDTEMKWGDKPVAAAQVRGTLIDKNGNPKQGGYTKIELEETGLKEFLDRKVKENAKISKGEVMDLLNNTIVNNMRETWLGDELIHTTMLRERRKRLSEAAEANAGTDLGREYDQELEALDLDDDGMHVSGAPPAQGSEPPITHTPYTNPEFAGRAPWGEYSINRLGSDDARGTDYRVLLMHYPENSTGYRAPDAHFRQFSDELAGHARITNRQVLNSIDPDYPMVPPQPLDVIFAEELQTDPHNFARVFGTYPREIGAQMGTIERQMSAMEDAIHDAHSAERAAARKVWAAVPLEARREATKYIAPRHWAAWERELAEYKQAHPYGPDPANPPPEPPILEDDYTVRDFIERRAKQLFGTSDVTRGPLAEALPDVLDSYILQGDLFQESPADVFRNVNKLRDERAALSRQYASLEREREQYGSQAIPEVPLEADIYKIMVKRLLYQAAVEGRDGIAWAPGHFQGVRWGKRGWVDEISYDPARNRVYGYSRGQRVLELSTEHALKAGDYKLTRVVDKETAARLEAAAANNRPITDEDIIKFSDEQTARYEIDHRPDRSTHYPYRVVHEADGEVDIFETEEMAREFIEDRVDREVRRWRQEGGGATRIPVKPDGGPGWVGAQGFVTIYDELIPNQVRRDLKKLDKGAKIERLWMVDDAGDPVLSREGNVSNAPQVENQVLTYTIKLTPRMRAKLLEEGAPLYSKNAPVGGLLDGEVDPGQIPLERMNEGQIERLIRQGSLL